MELKFITLACAGNPSWLSHSAMPKKDGIDFEPFAEAAADARDLPVLDDPMEFFHAGLVHARQGPLKLDAGTAVQRA